MADVEEAEPLELRRSSRAEVSQTIAAIDDDRTSTVEQLDRIAQDMADRDVNRSPEVRSVVLVRWQSVDNLHAGGEHPEKFAMLDLPHCYARIAARAERAVSTIVSPLPAAIRAVSTS